MPIWITGSLVFVVLGLGGFMFSRGRTARLDAKSGATVDSEIMVNMSVSGIDSLLNRLQVEEAPEPTMGAMCYSVMAPPDSVEYICPDCGERTVYGSDEVYFLSWGLERCRAIAGNIDSSDMVDASLDESSYCSSCRPDAEGQALVLTVTLDDGREVVSEVTRFDLNILQSFLAGQLYYSTDNDGTQPLKPHAGRIAELLGTVFLEETH